MAEESRTHKNSVKPSIHVSNSSFSGVSRTSSVPSSLLGLRNSKSLKNNCLCSPTTHAGSFRCRYHRNSELTRNSMSVGAKLSELGANMSVGSKLPVEAGQVAQLANCQE